MEITFRCFLSVLWLLVALPAFAQAQIAWAPSFTAAMQEATSRKTLVMVDLYTDW